MICPECKCTVPDEMIACPACAMKNSARAMREYQRDALRRVLSGRGDLRTRAQKGVRHVQMFGAELTFCNLPIHVGDRRGWISLQTQTLAGICDACRTEILRAIEEARAA